MCFDWTTDWLTELHVYVLSSIVQESMEMIDNPLHEAAKRGNMDFMNECIANQVCHLIWSLTSSYIN